MVAAYSGRRGLSVNGSLGRPGPDTSIIGNPRVHPIIVDRGTLDSVSANNADPHAVLLITPQAYGVEFILNVPHYTLLVETAPRFPELYASSIFDYALYDTMHRLSCNKPGTLCKIRFDAVVGFLPTNNVMNLAQALAFFLATYSDVEGAA